MPKADVPRFGWEPILKVAAEANLQDMILEHYEELGRFKGTLKPALNFGLLAEMEKAGQMKLWTARVGSTFGGGIIFYLHRHLNYWDSGLRATDGGHYLAPQFRGNGWIGLKMWREALAALKAMDVRFVDAHDNTLAGLAPFFKRLGFEPFATHYGKEL